MYNNQLTKIPDSISALKNLTSLNLERNKIETISGRISFLNRLEYLRLSGNRIKSLPDKFHRLKNLEELHLDVNQMHKLPDTIVELPKLRDIFMKNKIGNFQQILHNKTIGNFKFKSKSCIKNAKRYTRVAAFGPVSKYNRIRKITGSFGLNGKVWEQSC